MKAKLKKLHDFLDAPVSAAPLAMFRMLFGGVMLASIVRFMLKGWVYDLYVQPKFYFTFYGFEWVKPLGEYGMYAIFTLMAATALAMAAGFFYRLSATLFFLAFTYVELIDKANYLNHYYFVSIVSFLMILVPAHRHFSLDVLRKPQLRVTHVPRWTVLIFQLQLGLVYFYAGVAKLNHDWLFRAMPLRIWLPAHTHQPLIGWLFHYKWVAYFFCWFGALYDLTIPFFLSLRKTRVFAYATVIAFHVMTAWLFQIGMFPYIMMLATLIFFPASFHENVLKTLRKPFGKTQVSDLPATANLLSTVFLKPALKNALFAVLALHFLLQVLLPWRFLLYPGQLFWTEQGFRFSWRVMLMEKAGVAFLYVKDAATGREAEVMNNEFLTVNQEKMMATQPDMLLQYAHLLRNEYARRGFKDPQVRAESYVTLNGSGSRLLVDPTVNLAAEQEGFGHKTWILPFETAPAATDNGLTAQNP